jgi:hypothetical protein
MNPDDLETYNNLRKELVRLKAIYNSILNVASKNKFDPEDDMYEYEKSITKFKTFAIELEHLPVEAKMITIKIDKVAIPVPPPPKVIKVPKKFEDEVDRMLFEFLEMKKSEILIRKISPNNYIFGTKRIFAKISNGQCLIRVGGGFADVSRFYD